MTTEVAVSDAVHHAVIDTGDDDLVTALYYKPEQADHGVVATEIFVYRPEPLIEVPETLHREQTRDIAADDDAPNGRCPRRLRGAPAACPHRTRQDLRVRSARLLARPGSSQDVLRRPPRSAAVQRSRPLEPGWPILTNSTRHGPAYVHEGAEVINSVLSAGCHVHGEVRNSVLGPGVVVEAGATVHDSIIFDDVAVGAGAQIFSIVAERCAFGAGSSSATRSRRRRSEQTAS